MIRRIAPAIMMAIAACLAPRASASAQQEARAFNVYLDCSDFFCDHEFFRTEIVSVNWVRERTAADVHVLATSQPTGGGGAT